MNNYQLNSLIYVLREWKNNDGVILTKTALVKFQDILINELSKYRKIKPDANSIKEVQEKKE